jgi:phage shock protein C
MTKKLYRSRKDRMISGVCGGIAEYLNIDSTLVRIVFAILAIGTFFTLLVAYFICVIVIPEKDGDYLVHLVAKENKKTLIDIQISIFDKDYAIQICDQWKDQSHVLYKTILSTLLSDLTK